MEAIRRLTTFLTVMAFGLPFLPVALNAPLMGGGYCGNAPLYGQQECMQFSLLFILAATVGTWVVHPTLPRQARRLTLMKSMVLGCLYLAIPLALS